MMGMEGTEDLRNPNSETLWRNIGRCGRACGKNDSKDYHRWGERTLDHYCIINPTTNPHEPSECDFIGTCERSRTNG